MSNNTVCCHSVCVSYLNDEHFTCHWKQVIFLKNEPLEGSIDYNSFKKKKTYIYLQELKVPQQTLFESSVSNPSASAMSAVHSWLLCMVTWALLRQLKSPHCIPRLILLIIRPIVEARGKKTWMLLVAQTSHSEELSHPCPLPPWHTASPCSSYSCFLTTTHRGFQLLSSSRFSKATIQSSALRTDTWWWQNCRAWQSWEAHEQPLAPSTHMMLQVGKHRPASSEQRASWVTCNFSHSFPEIRLMTQKFAPLICKIAELPLMSVIHSHTEKAYKLKWQHPQMKEEMLGSERSPSDISRCKIWHC